MGDQRDIVRAAREAGTNAGLNPMQARGGPGCQWRRLQLRALPLDRQAFRS